MQLLGRFPFASPSPSAEDGTATADTFKGLVLMDDHRLRLEKLRDQLADAIATTGPNVLPQLAAQYRATLADLSALPAALKTFAPGSTDDLKQRRADRIAKAQVVEPAPVKVQRNRK